MTENNTDSIFAIEESGKSLKETLRAQQQLLQKLYNELDVEREASSSAASEALAMILRLQGEKASVKMESEHYKRLAEEKMCHAEESMEIFEEQIHQKEMEIASLDCQLQAYRYKLASLGFEDIEANETSHESLLRRNSAPPKLLRLAYLKRHRSISPDSDIISTTLDENVGEDESLELEKQSYWDQIRKLDKIVEEMAGDEYVNLRIKSSKPSSGFPQTNELDENQSVKKLENDETPSDTCSLSVHDVFEVPEIEVVLNHENEAKDNNGKLILGGENKLEKVLIFPEEAIKSYEKMLLLKQKEKGENIVVDCQMAIDFPVEGSSQQVKRREDEIEDEQVGITGKEEVLRLLNEINQKLDSIQFEIRNGNKKNENLSQNYDLQMLQLSEAMLHFWL
ncbi:unnamed protein product [Lactuca saligna]|uniref:GTD-binding domain-containing protein n=1 Tax=Lactuca saligna TaxID=75948 RepID=A0AA35ZTZ7_LACSI|nr:unnamed protein product [Lactuca saligna]